MLVTKFCKPSTTTDQDFRDFITAVRTAFTDLGWVRTSDTGQIDPTTAVKPAATSQIVGYDIMRFGDALHATAPFFLKIDYGSASGSLSFNQLGLQIGTGTNGAGTLTGNVGTRLTVGSGATDNNLRACIFAGNASRIAFCLWYDTANPNRAQPVIIERSHADDGSDTGERVDMAAVLSTSSSWFQSVPNPLVMLATPVRGVAANLPCLIPQAAVSGTFGVNVGAFPIFPNNDGPLRNPMLGMFLYVSADMATLQDVSVTMYGVLRTYRTMGWLSYAAYGLGGATTSPMLLVS